MPLPFGVLTLACIELPRFFSVKLLTSQRRVAATKAQGISRAFRRNQELWRRLKSPSVLPSTLIARIFLDRLFLSAAECPFFDRFFLWFGSHRDLSYNNMREISQAIFCGHTGLRNLL